jgi:hypothetical protein
MELDINPDWVQLDAAGNIMSAMTRRPPGLHADIRWLRQNKNASSTFPNASAEFT